MASPFRRFVPGLTLALVAGAGCLGVPTRNAESSIPAPTRGVTATRVPVVAPEPEVRQASAVGEQQVPITLDLVFRVAESRNPQLAAAREALDAAAARRAIAGRAWIPELYVGTAYYRHEGGIQLQEGPLVRSSTGSLFAGGTVGARVDAKAILAEKLGASQQLLTKQATLRKQTSETLLEAAMTYIELMTAHVVLREAEGLEAEIKQLIDRAKTRAEVDRTAGADVLRLQAELTQQQQTVRSSRQTVAAIEARLTYLLGFDAEEATSIRLLPAEPEFVPLRLIEPSTPTDALVSQALANGPGLEDLRRLIALAQQGQDTARRTAALPVVNVRMLEGPFGAGANSSLDWANRFDLGFEAGWTLPRPGTIDATRRAGNAQIREAQFTYQDLRNQLAFGVREGAEAIRSGEDQLSLCEVQLRQAQRMREMVRERAKLAPSAVSESDALAVIRGEQLARLNYVNTLRAYNKAQVRLTILIGGSCEATAR